MKLFSTWFAGEQNESLPPASCKVFVKQKSSHGVRNNVSSFQSFGPSPSLHRHHAFLGLVASETHNLQYVFMIYWFRFC